MEDVEEALRNIDIFCRVLVKKIAEDEDPQDIVVEPIEKLLRTKYTVEEHLETDPLAKHLIPLPQAEEPLIDIFEDDKYVKILMQYRCKDQQVIIRRDADGLQICTEECRKLNLPIKHLQMENMIARCKNNEVFEIDIPKIETSMSYDD